MANGSQLDSIEAILTGEEPIPDSVTNRLLLAAIRSNYQLIQEHERCWQDCKDDIDNLETAMKIQIAEIENMKKTSSRWDKILGIATGLGTAVGFYFGQK